MHRNPLQRIVLMSLLVLSNSCITPFIPKTNEDKKILVVEGLVTDQPDTTIIKLSKSLPLGTSSISSPVQGCLVTISDDLGNTFVLTETIGGTYVTDPSEFQGRIGRIYTLHISTNSDNNNLSYQSSPVEMKYVPPIDSLFYEKVTIQENNGTVSQEGCQVLLNTHDPGNQTKFYRWEYSETWEFMLPYTVPNQVCWLYNNSDIINIKNTSALDEARINRYALNFISNLTDRLRIKYSILVKQYSLNEEEYQYWEKLQNITEQVGSLYDLTPSSIPSNVYCLNDPNENVLGYFSVSASTSKRLFIKDHFAGIYTPYTNGVCIDDTIFGSGPIQSLNTFVWVIVDQPFPPPGYKVTTRVRGCYDCTVRGTNVPPSFWNEDK